tara:strand:- start:838 stop:1224 length:387 start_codon:yes stop_codon:yes gene_type:complete
MKKYCPECGKPNPAAAKFCCNCGSSISLQSKGSKKTPPKKGIEIIDEDENEDEEQYASIEATQLDVDISYNEPMGKETIGQIMASGGPDSQNETFQRSGGPEMSQEQFLEEFKREAGPITKGPPIGKK